MGETSVKRPDALPTEILVSGDGRNRIVWDLSRLTFYPPVDGAKRAATSKT
jgi:hypothetical protein